MKGPEPAQGVLVLAPTGRDAALIRETLVRAGIRVRVCADAADLASALGAADAAIVVEESLDEETSASVRAALERQPVWSDLPLIVLGMPYASTGVGLLERLAPTANVTLVERPTRPFTLVTVARAALRARDRQYQMRDRLAELVDAREQVARQRDKLEQQARVFDITLSAITDFAYIFDREGRFVYANRALLDLWGRPFDQVVGRTFFELDYPDELARKHHGEIVSAFAGQEVRGEAEYLSPAGVWGYYEYIFVPVRGADGSVEFVAGSTREISQRKRLEDRRRELLEAERSARAEAERVGRLKDEFLSTLSHELRTPLNAITGWIQLLQRGHLSEADRARAIETISRNTQSQKELIEDLLDMSRIVSGKARLDVQEVDLRLLVANALESVRPAAEAKSIALTAEVDEAPERVQADPARLQQILWNLVNNAVKFTPANGKVRVRVTRDAGKVRIEVADTGIGIAPEFLPQVFDRFRQGDASSTRRHGGLGLGLSIVRQLAEMHAGEATVDSPGEGLGSVFTVTLPIRAPVGGAGPARAHAQGPAAPRRAEPVPLDGAVVLIVDDDPDGREITGRLLGELGATVLGADSADEAEAVLASQRVDALLSDVGMPVRDGFDLIRAVRSSADETVRAIPAIALTAFARVEDREDALRAGYDEHVTKPVDPAVLSAAVARLLGRIPS